MMSVRGAGGAARSAVRGAARGAARSAARGARLVHTRHASKKLVVNNLINSQPILFRTKNGKQQIKKWLVEKMIHFPVIDQGSKVRSRVVILWETTIYAVEISACGGREVPGLRAGHQDEQNNANGPDVRFLGVISRPVEDLWSHVRNGANNVIEGKKLPLWRPEPLSHPEVYQFHNINAASVLCQASIFGFDIQMRNAHGMDVLHCHTQLVAVDPHEIQVLIAPVLAGEGVCDEHEEVTATCMFHDDPVVFRVLVDIEGFVTRDHVDVTRDRQLLPHDPEFAFGVV
mmetsp:Transcript_13248/g.18975  ORF Transcript_13248/g.18975 Transcript_13248/m.18975 type:complete len:287 (+) Transcript_13248:127-987(+)